MADQKKKKITVQWEDLPGSVEDLEADTAYTIAIRREVVPILFVAGFGGSRLETTAGNKIWDPDDALFMAWTYGMFWSTPSARKELLVGKRHRSGRLRVMDQQGFCAQKDKKAGGPVARTSYGDLMDRLEKNAWPDAVKLCLHLPVHSFGYDWTDDIRTSGKKLAEHIRGVIKEYTGKGRRCEKVILITHSTGGLVARWVCHCEGAAGSVLGAIHGAQPIHGTPLTYWVMKAGFKQPSSEDYGEAMNKATNAVDAVTRAAQVHFTPYILGSTGRHTAATLGNMPGALQLLPSGRYRTNARQRGWLTMADASEIFELRQPGGEGEVTDPFSSIYLDKDSYWRLVTPELLEPRPDESGRSAQVARKDFEQNIGKARAFHEELADHQHRQTFHLYGEGTAHATADEVRFDIGPSARRKVRGKIKRIAVDASSEQGLDLLHSAHGLAEQIDGNAGPREVIPSFLKGGYSAEVDAGGGTFLHATLQQPDGAGDGTIPVSSGSALKEQRGTVRSTGVTNVDHQTFFNNDNRTVQMMVLEYIKQLCQEKIEDGSG